MTWNEEIAEGAQNWSQFLLQNRSLLHAEGLLDLAEDLSSVFSSPAQPICNSSSETSCVRCSQLVSTWFKDVPNNNFDTVSPINGSGQNLFFTQVVIRSSDEVVWRSSTEFGVGVSSGGGYHYVVARYKLQGNLTGRFDRNVSRLLPTAL